MVHGGDHFNIVQPIGKLLAAKMLSDHGPKYGIVIKPQEVSQAFAAR